MTIKGFFDTFEGLWVETNRGTDLSTNQQCVDLWRAYNRKVINAPDIFGNPPDIWNKYQADFYDKIPNTPTGVPQLGDVIIWSKTYGGIGHIAICTDIANTKTFTSFDQNDPVGEPCHYQPHTYTGVLGWLRPKNQSALVGETEESVLIKILAEAFASLSDDDALKKGNLEGYLRSIVDEHKTPEVIPDATKAGLEGQVTTLNEHLEDISKALKMPLPENAVDDMVRRIGELVVTEQNYVNFVEYVAKSIDCPEKTETAVRNDLAGFASLKDEIKKRRLEDFGAWEKIASGIIDLFLRRR